PVSIEAAAVPIQTLKEQSVPFEGAKQGDVVGNDTLGYSRVVARGMTRKGKAQGLAEQAGGKVVIDGKNTWAVLTPIAQEVASDNRIAEGIPGGIGAGQELGGTVQDQGAGTEAARPSGIFQTQESVEQPEQKIIPPEVIQSLSGMSRDEFRNAVQTTKHGNKGFAVVYPDGSKEWVPSSTLMKTEASVRGFAQAKADALYNRIQDQAVQAPAATASTTIDEQAHQAATSPLNEIPEPTQGQKEAGNYQKGHIQIQGMDVSIENPAGSIRSGTSPNGQTWETTMQHHYGYIKGTLGKDKDHLDTFIGPQHGSDQVFVVNQQNPDTGKFDEHKVMLGFDSEESARQAYLDNYAPGWNGLKNIIPMTMEQFKEWSKDPKLTKQEAKPDETPKIDEDEVFLKSINLADHTVEMTKEVIREKTGKKMKVKQEVPADQAVSDNQHMTDLLDRVLNCLAG
ncbi:MAG TPA: hypothetical protein DCE18_04835, partial [Syntrophobacteraceae bacterium]|nr:hypothetical protein [Syntrophobacteraceae bacterium]